MSHSAHRYRLLVIDAHPRAGSLGEALANSVVEGATPFHEVRRLTLRDLNFDLNYLRQHSLEPDLQHSREMLVWAEHMVMVYPVWWGTMPALFKGWLDRIFQPGFAFAERSDGAWDGLLKGRSATLVATMDTPTWVFRWILRAPSIHALRAATLNFCGIAPVDVLLFSPVKQSTPQQRAMWLQQVGGIGQALDGKLRTGVKARAKVWLQVMRPQFYLFPWLALTTGAVCATSAAGTPWQWMPYCVAWGAAWGMEFIAVLTNEIHDFATDRANNNHGPFTGGSRVLVDGRLTEADLRMARAVTVAVVAGLALLQALLVPRHALAAPAFLALGLLLGIGYTAPPLKLVHRGLGELNVAFTHSVLLIWCGHLSQSAPWTAGPWLIALPLFFSVLPSIILAGFPDAAADEGAGKRTLKVRFGAQKAVGLAMAATGIALAMRVGVAFSTGGFVWTDGFLAMHATVLCFMLARCHASTQKERINGLLALSLSYMIWFAFAPLLRPPV